MKDRYSISRSEASIAKPQSAYLIEFRSDYSDASKLQIQIENGSSQRSLWCNELISSSLSSCLLSWCIAWVVKLTGMDSYNRARTSQWKDYMVTEVFQDPPLSLQGICLAFHTLPPTWNFDLKTVFSLVDSCGFALRWVWQTLVQSRNREQHLLPLHYLSCHAWREHCTLNSTLKRLAYFLFRRCSCGS